MEITAVLVARSGPETQASVAGELITVNGVEYDLAPIPEGGEARPTGDHPFMGPMTRTEGVLRVSLFWFYDTATAEPSQGPERPVLTITSGDVPDPVKRKPVIEEIEDEL